MNDFPDGFPLESKDKNGENLSENDLVKILEIPEWLLHNLDDESKEIVKSCEDKEMKIIEIDSYGYAWVEVVTESSSDEYKCNSFSIEPKNLLKL